MILEGTVCLKEYHPNLLENNTSIIYTPPTKGTRKRVRENVIENVPCKRTRREAAEARLPGES